MRRQAVLGFARLRLAESLRSGWAAFASALYLAMVAACLVA